MDINKCRDCYGCWHAGNKVWRCMKHNDKKINEIKDCVDFEGIYKEKTKVKKK